MNNQRYDKLNAIIYLQNQKSHYKRILQAKKNINFQQRARMHTVTHINNKYTKLQDKQRKSNNLKMIMRIGEINSGQGVLQRFEMQAQKNRNKKDYSHDYQHKVLKDQLDSDNQRFSSKLKTVRPLVGTKHQWKNHFKNVKNFQKKLRKHSLSKQYDPQHRIRDTITSFKRMQQDNDKSISYPKDHQVKMNNQKLNIKKNNESSESVCHRRTKKRKFHKSVKKMSKTGEQKDKANVGKQDQKDNQQTQIQYKQQKPILSYESSK